ncbi:Skp family chaperone for outer membrane proteins [Anoxybacillus tepidamans]|uniref:Skp family chaperone for outer membrane proteins n=1 Tax=Anoxybacteroides tepidamans TaxID=265948 RepID=A0A7W8MWU1_9BACL|nr:YqkE family protein [Anoxybacillus tepidamans]MBB5326293.1 Skp family chaperone for outer membrane proteins [Anoxybacillus tepidamans]
MKKRQPTLANQAEEKITLKDYLDTDLYAKLRAKKSALEAEEKRKKAEEEARKREEQRQREKNKTFEELLNESNLDWRKFKE